MGAHTPVFRDRNLQLVFIVTLVAVMGVASIAPAFPQIIRHFRIGERDVEWLVAAFTLPGVFLTPVMGVLADRLGRKNILVPSLILFGLAGFACVFVGDYRHLLLLRFLQGIGAASLGSINVTLIGDLFSGSRRIEAMGYNASVLSIGTASYPAIGGLLATAGWRYPFALPVLAVPLGVLVALRLEAPGPGAVQTLGSYLAATWKNLNRQSVWGLFLLNILVFFLLYGAYLTYLPILLGSRLESTPLAIGLVMSATSATTAAVAASAGKWNKLLRPRTVLIAGILCYMASMALYAGAFSYASLLAPALLFGVAQGMMIPTMQTQLLGFAPIEQRAAFMSINSMVLRAGQTAGPLVLGLAYAHGGVSWAFFGGGLVAVLMLAIVLGMVRLGPVRD